MRIGVVGLGNMGSAVARNLLRAGNEVHVYDLRPDAVAAMVGHGAVAGHSPAQLIDRCEVLVSMVFGPAQIERVVTAGDGFLSTNCTGTTWIDLTTSNPALMRRLAAQFTEAGGHAVDAPVTGSLDSAIRGDMILFVGGTDVDVERVRPVLDAIGVTRRVGQYGNGYVAKLVNNQLWFVHAAAIGEAMVAAKAAGLDPEVWWEAMKGGAADSFVLQHDVPSIFAGHYDPSFRLALCLKDLGLVDELLRDTGTRAEITQAAYARFREAEQRYGEDAGEMTVCKLIEDDAGLSLRVEGDWVAPWDVTHPSEG